MKKIAIAADHAGFEYKEYIKNQLKDQYELVDFGTHSADSVDYADFVHPAAKAVENGDCEFGILFVEVDKGYNLPPTNT
jgi:ribose 5-phosphate isomerase B